MVLLPSQRQYIVIVRSPIKVPAVSELAHGPRIITVALSELAHVPRINTVALLHLRVLLRRRDCGIRCNGTASGRTRAWQLIHELTPYPSLH
jgi:hypothetical protein